MKVNYSYIDDILYAWLDEYSYTLYYCDGSWEPTFPVFISYPKDMIKYIDEEDAKKIFGNNDPSKLLLIEYDRSLRREDYYSNDSLRRFIDDFIEYAVDDYHEHYHNNDGSLIYKASELDEHYNMDSYVSFFDEYYDEFVIRKSKNEFMNVNIIKKDNDYIIEFDEKILEEMEDL